MPASEPDPWPAVAALIVAAGRGVRAGGDLPKQYRVLAGEPVLTRTLRAFLDAAAVGRVLVMIGAEDDGLYESCLKGVDDARLLPPVTGGATRQDSVRFGLEALAAQAFAGTVLVHDAARPFVGAGLIHAAVEAARAVPGAIPVLAVTDTVKRVGPDGLVVGTLDRGELAAVQTPQAFRFDALLGAHRQAHAAGLAHFTDDAAVLEWAGHAIATFPGETGNLKLTRPEDFAEAERRLAPALSVRVGTGYDVHAFTAGDHVWLGGVRIPHSHGIDAHSDGDVILHALTDAILGALADGDIGTHFPPSDPQWRGASSDRFLAHAVTRLRARGGRIDHLDISLVCEAPRVGPHREAIRARIAEIAGVSVDRVGLKATTSERMGFVGRREGLAALATATVRLPEDA